MSAPPIWVLPALAALATAVLAVLLLPSRAGLAAAATLAPSAALGVVLLRRRPIAVGTPATLPIALDLLAAALQAGATTAAALRSVAVACAARPSRSERSDAEPDAAVPDVLARVAALLDLGAPPRDAWATALATYSHATGPAWEWVAATATRSADSGMRLAQAWQRLAGDLRAELHAAQLASVQRAAVWALLPLGACFLPAFIALGVVPVIAGVVSGVGLP